MSAVQYYFFNFPLTRVRAVVNTFRCDLIITRLVCLDRTGQNCCLFFDQCPKLKKNEHTCVQVNIPPLLSAKRQYKIMKKQIWTFTQHTARLVRFKILLCLNIGCCAQTTSVVVRQTKLKIIAWVWSRKKAGNCFLFWWHDVTTVQNVVSLKGYTTIFRQL